MLALQLGNLYLLMALMGIGILYYTNDPKIVRNYIIVLAIGDIGHLATTGSVIGWEGVKNFAGWNEVTWGNIGATVFLFVTRVAYLSGLLGANRVPGGKTKKV